jgi:pre-rRNA-processing protein TSR4
VRGIRGVRVGEVARDEAAKAAPDAIAVGGGEPNPPPPPAEEEKEKPNLGATLFGVAPSAPSASARANPFSTTTPNPSAGGGPNPFSPPPAASLAAKPAQTPRQQPATAQQPSLAETFAAKARISPTDPPSPSIVPPALPPRAHESWPSPADQPTPYAHFHLDADYETLSAPPSAPPTTTATLDDSAEGGGGGGVNDREDKLLFESAMDRAFQTFADRLAHNPEQVLRYEFGGAPLLCSAADAIGRRLLPDKRLAMPPCESCGAARVFEAQLTPHAIAELEDGDEGVEGMEWGTVILGVCGRDCVPRGVGAGEAGYLEEWVGVQWEEVVKNT